MDFEILDRLDEEFPTFAFGTNKEGELFVNGKKVALTWSKNEDLDVSPKLKASAQEAVYEAVRDMLLKKKIIKYVTE